LLARRAVAGVFLIFAGLRAGADFVAATRIAARATIVLAGRKSREAMENGERKGSIESVFFFVA